MAGLIQSFSHRFDRRFSKAGGVSFPRLLDGLSNLGVAYSLRKLRTDSPANALRVRRSTDNVEVDVGYDGNNAVSTSSPITNVSGEPAIPLSLGTGWVKITGSAGTETLSPAGSLNIGGTYGTPYRVKISMGETVASGNTVAFSGYVNSVTGSNWRVYPAQSDNSIATSGSPLSLTSSGSFNGSFLLNADAVSFVIENSSGTENFQLNYGVAGTRSVGDTAATTLAAFIAEESSPDMHVVTWYDQTGNGRDLVNATASTQPVIVESGIYSDAVTFEADDSVLSVGSITTLGSGSMSHYQILAELDSTFGYNSVGLNAGFVLYWYFANGALTCGFSGGVAAGAANTVGEFNQFTTVGNASNINIFKNNTAYGVASSSAATPYLTSFQLGGGGPLSVNTRFQMKELIFMDTDDGTIKDTITLDQISHFNTPD